MIASNLTAANNGNITVGRYTNLNTKEETINKDAKLNILNAKDSKYSYEFSSREKMDADEKTPSALAHYRKGIRYNLAGATIVGAIGVTAANIAYYTNDDGTATSWGFATAMSIFALGRTLHDLGYFRGRAKQLEEYFQGQQYNIPEP